MYRRLSLAERIDRMIPDYMIYIAAKLSHEIGMIIKARDYLNISDLLVLYNELPLSYLLQTYLGCYVQYIFNSPGHFTEKHCPCHVRARENITPL